VSRLQRARSRHDPAAADQTRLILVDTSVWIQHLRSGDERLAALLNGGEVLGHPFVIGELALGNLRQREAVLSDLRDLPRAIVASDAEALGLIDRQTLFGRGIGYVDAHLLAAVRLTAGSRLWTAIGACWLSQPGSVWPRHGRTDPHLPGNGFDLLLAQIHPHQRHIGSDDCGEAADDGYLEPAFG
jgi:predicted nucleic acid-binding protein